MKSAKVLEMRTPSSKDSPGRGAPGRRRPGIALKSERDVRRFLQKIINEARHGEITADQLRALVYAANSLISLFDRFDLSKPRRPKVLGNFDPSVKFDYETGKWVKAKYNEETDEYDIQKAPVGENEAGNA